MNLTYLYLLAPLHTGGASQEGNLVGIARESHTELPYAPSSTVRGRLRAFSPDLWTRLILFGPDLDDLKIQDKEPAKQQKKEALHKKYEDTFGKKLTQLEQGKIWIGDASILWIPVSSLSHSVIWVTCPALLQRWKIRSGKSGLTLPKAYQAYLGEGENDSPVYLKDSILKTVKPWDTWKDFVPKPADEILIQRVLVLPDQHCASLIQMSLWRQVKVKLDEHKTVDGGFRYEEAIPPDTLMYFPWDLTTQAQKIVTNNQTRKTEQDPASMFEAILAKHPILQLGGQESLGRGFVEQWTERKSVISSDTEEKDLVEAKKESEQTSSEESHSNSETLSSETEDNATNNCEETEHQLIEFDPGELGKRVYQALTALRQPYQEALDREQIQRDVFEKHLKEQKGQAVELYSYLSTWGLMRLKAEESALDKWKPEERPNIRQRAEKNQEGKREVVESYFRCLASTVEEDVLSGKGALDVLLTKSTEEYLGLTGLGLAIAQEFSFWATAVYYDIKGEA